MALSQEDAFNFLFFDTGRQAESIMGERPLKMNANIM